MKIVLGLGNPGSRYERTRHNVGWLLLDAVAERLRAEFVPGKGDYWGAAASWRGRRVTLVKPTTFMNLSGNAARQVLRHTGATIDDLLVVVDEIQFPLGRLKITPSGSDGGHNGLASLVEVLGSDRFARLRCGVGNDFPPGRMVDYVLSDFPSEDREALERMVEDGRDAILLWIAEGTGRSMNRVNARRNQDSSTNN